MAQNIKKLNIFALCLVMLVGLLPAYALAQGNIELDRDVKLTVYYHYESTNVEGMEFKLYRIADVAQNGDISAPVGEFAGAPMDLTALDAQGFRDAAETLVGFVQLNGIQPLYSGKTGADGKVTFPNDGTAMKAGLYLGIGSKRKFEGYIYAAEPFIICLPARNGTHNTWDYETEVVPKLERWTATDQYEVTKIKVLKDWDDAGHKDKRPKEITVHLFKNGKKYDTVKLNEANRWRHSWDDLPAEDDWHISEEPVAGYTPKITKHGVTFVVKNTYGTGGKPPAKPTDGEKLTQTGTSLYLVPILMCAGLIFTVVGVVLRKREGLNEK